MLDSLRTTSTFHLVHREARFRRSSSTLTRFSSSVPRLHGPVPLFLVAPASRCVTLRVAFHTIYRCTDFTNDVLLTTLVFGYTFPSQCEPLFVLLFLVKSSFRFVLERNNGSVWDNKLRFELSSRLVLVLNFCLTIV